MKKDELQIKKTKDGCYVLYNKYTGGHSHFKDRKGACNCKSLLEKGIMPKSRYYQMSAKRVLRKSDFKKLSKIDDNTYIRNRFAYV